MRMHSARSPLMCLELRPHHPTPSLRARAPQTAAQALDAFQSEAEASGSPAPPISGAAVLRIVQTALARGNYALAVSVLDASLAAAAAPRAAPSPFAWPRAELVTLQTVLLGLARAVQVAEARRVLDVLVRGGAARNSEVPFGHVVASPLAPNPPLAVVRPDEGVRTVACGVSRYPYELFSGVVAECASESRVSEQSSVLGALRSLGMWGRPPSAATHTMLVRAPTGEARTFRFATDTADVPAAPGDRVTLVCAPSAAGGLWSRAPPKTKPGEPLSLWNHSMADATRSGTPGAAELPPRPSGRALQRPPDADGSRGGLPGWAPTLALVLAASDAGSGLVDPALPALLAWGAASVAAAGLVGARVVIPELKRLPAPAVRVERVRQQLLEQHVEVSRRLRGTAAQANADIEALARLSQLRDKMRSVGGGGVTGGAGGAGGAGSYAARLERVEAAAGGLEERLRRGVELVDGYARVLSMIEIEVEMDAEVPAAELVTIGNEIDKLAEVDAMREEWQITLEAQDEVERLLRGSQG